MQYSVLTTILKGVFGAGASGTAGVLILWAYNGFATNDWTVTPEASIAIAAAAAAVWAVAKNWFKNYVVPKMDRIKFMKMLAIGGACGLMIGAQGCATMVPAVGGKTEIETTFSDVVGPDGVQNTQYNQKLKAPAGVEAKDLASMTYDWNPDQSGSISVSSDRSADTMGQAELLKSAFEANNAQVNMLMQALIGLGGLAQPLIGQKMQSDSLNQSAELANKAQLQSMIVDIVKQALAQQAAAEKQYTPLDDLKLQLPALKN